MEFTTIVKSFGERRGTMNTYKLTFTVNGKRTETIVRANSIMDAKKLVQAQYAGARINFISTGHEYL